MQRTFLVLFILLFFIPESQATSDPHVIRYFEKKGVRVEIHRDTFQGHNIRYLETYLKDENDTLIFLLHGAQSHAMQFKKIMSDTSLLRFAKIVALDRPGYDESSPGEPMLEIARQTALLDHILSGYEFRTCILVGHSYGGAIVANYAARNPGKDLKLLLLAPAIDPDLERIFFTSHMINYKFTKLLMPEPSRVAAIENMAHESELRKILPIWSELKVPIIHLHGMLDMVIPFENIHFSRKYIPPDQLEIVLLEDAGHMLIRFKREMIISLIKKLSEEC